MYHVSKLFKVSLILAIVLTSITFISSPHNARAASYSATNSTFADVDGNSATRTVTIAAGAGETVSGVTIAINFLKSGNTCASDDGSIPWDDEIVFSLKNPLNTTVNLVNKGTFSTGGTSAGTVTITFSDAGGALPAHPATGTFHPVGALATFNGTNPTGDWTLTIQDTFAADHLCVNNFTLTVLTGGDAVTAPATTPVPQPGCSVLLSLPTDAAVGTLIGNADAYWKPGQLTDPLVTLPPGKSFWVLGMSHDGQYYEIYVECQKVWVRAETMGPNYDTVWNGHPLPTTDLEGDSSSEK